MDIALCFSWRGGRGRAGRAAGGGGVAKVVEGFNRQVSLVRMLQMSSSRRLMRAFIGGRKAVFLWVDVGGGDIVCPPTFSRRPAVLIAVLVITPSALEGLNVFLFFFFGGCSMGTREEHGRGEYKLAEGVMSVVVVAKVRNCLFLVFGSDGFCFRAFHGS